MKQRPVAIGLLTCEQVIVEEKTRNITPVNCFTRRSVEHFPSEVFPFVVFAMLTDGAGEMPLAVSISRLDTLDEIFRRSVSVKFANPLQEVRCVVRIRGCSFPVAGHYEIMLLADNEMVAQRKILITAKETST
jgi:hypothetical protein